MVREMRVPSSSSSNSVDRWLRQVIRFDNVEAARELTNGDWLNPDAFLKMCIRGIVSIFTLEDLLAAKSVYECCST
jgi:hypothetical protein